MYEYVALKDNKEEQREVAAAIEGALLEIFQEYGLIVVPHRAMDNELDWSCQQSAFTAKFLLVSAFSTVVGKDFTVFQIKEKPHD
jgi:hypothetical protein